MLRDTAISLGVFVAVTLIALAAGAANLGTALGIGQVAFIATVAVLLGYVPRSERTEPERQVEG
jgi:hypothetical protein